ncbi:uncharacterized protein LOC115322680 [Ixodes scapularis]|uniref:uncharacterized protein LOC115322680 n=1 Tax=Ixodes scapularis TaxID=6945 RepID=UPI001C39449E|nr:uncharacterized protein LOC115322680 [Ixodes scapularis]
MTVSLLFAFTSYSRLPENIDNIAQAMKEVLSDVYNLYKRTKIEVGTLTVTNYASFSDSLINKLLDCKTDLPGLIYSALEDTPVLGGLKKLTENMRLIASEMKAIKAQVTSVNNLLRDIERRTSGAADELERACPLPMSCLLVDAVVTKLKIVTKQEVNTSDFDSAKSPIEDVSTAVNLRDTVQNALTKIIDPVVEGAKNVIKTVGKGLSTINDVFVFESFASQDKADAFFEPVRKTLDKSAHYGDLYIALSVFILVVLSAALVCYLTGLWCIIIANNTDCSHLITVGVFLFSITFLLPMITSTFALCLGFVGQRTLCDIVSDLRQPEVQTLVRGVMILVRKTEESQSRVLLDQPWRPTWPDSLEGRRFSTISSGLGGSYQEASKAWTTKGKSWLVWPVGHRVFSDLWLLRTGMSVSAEVRSDRAPKAEPQLLQLAASSNVTVSKGLAKVMTPTKVTEILRRFSECGDKDLSAFNLIGSNTVIELFNLVVPSAKNFSWLFDDTKSLPIKVTKELDRALQDLANGSLEKFVPDLPTLERKVRAVNMTKLNISDVKGKVSDERRFLIQIDGLSILGLLAGFCVLGKYR